MFSKGAGLGRILALAAVVVFALAAIGEWPSDLEDDLEPVALGLALLAGSLALE
jgi:hypothetical protein